MSSSAVLATLALSSNSAGVAVDQNGSRMRFDLDPPLLLPAGAICRLLRASLWYDSPNITAALPGGNTVSFTEQPAAILRTLTIPPGLYSLTDLTETIQELLETLGSSYVVRLVPDAATSKVSLNAKDPTGVSTSSDWNFAAANGVLNQRLGFTGAITALPGSWYESTNPASLNQLNAYIVHSSFTGGGTTYYGGRGGSTTLDLINITATPGSQILFEPQHPLEVRCHEGRLDGGFLWLTSENGATPVQTSEPWTVLLEFRG